MNTSGIIRRSPLVSCLLLPLVLLSFLAFPIFNAVSYGHVSGSVAVNLFGVGFVWQIFTVYHHRQRVLPWLLLGAYACALILFIVMVVA
jgi:hypothetical protein